MRARHVGHSAVVAGDRIKGNPHADQRRITDRPKVWSWCGSVSRPPDSLYNAWSCHSLTDGTRNSCAAIPARRPSQTKSRTTVLVPTSAYIAQGLFVSALLRHFAQVMTVRILTSSSTALAKVVSSSAENTSGVATNPHQRIALITADPVRGDRFQEQSNSVYLRCGAVKHSVLLALRILGCNFFRPFHNTGYEIDNLSTGKLLSNIQRSGPKHSMVCS